MISIIGAGAIGLYSAYLLSKKGYDVQIFDQKKKIGLPVQCTGIVTSKINEIIELKENIIKNRIKKIEIYSKNNSASINLKEPDIILDRERFDNWLAEKAEKAGAKLFLQNKFIGKEENNIVIKDLKQNKIKKIRPDYIIGADGPLSSIYNILNPKAKRTFYKGIQIRAHGNFEKDCFQVHLGSVCPDFFAWVVPENESTARIGLASLYSQKALLKEFLRKLDIKKAIDMQAGLIPVYSPGIKTQEGNIFLVGDAASQLKASTGGGIVQGLIAANSLADSIINKKDYEKGWKKKLAKDLWIHLKLRQYLNKFLDKDYDRLVELLNNNRLKNILETESRDALSKFLLKIIFAEPRLISFANKLF